MKRQSCNVAAVLLPPEQSRRKECHSSCNCGPYPDHRQYRGHLLLLGPFGQWLDVDSVHLLINAQLPGRQFAFTQKSRVLLSTFDWLVSVSKSGVELIRVVPPLHGIHQISSAGFKLVAADILAHSSKDDQMVVVLTIWSFPVPIDFKGHQLPIAIAFDWKGLDFQYSAREYGDGIFTCVLH